MSEQGIISALKVFCRDPELFYKITAPHEREVIARWLSIGGKS